MKSIPIVFNPTAGGGRLLRDRDAMNAAAHETGHQLDWLATQERGHGEELARQAAAEGHRLVLAFGGDGTYNEVARGLMGTPTALGVLPGGTTSVLAYEFGMARPAPHALKELFDGSDRSMRLGRTDRGDVFLLMVSAGPDAIVVRNVADRLKWLGGRSGVAAQAIVELMRARPLPRMKATIDQRAVDGGWVIVGNSRCYGGPYHATPGADPFTDGLEIVVQKTVGRCAAIPFALGIPSGRHAARRDVVRIKGNRVRVDPVPDAAEVPYQVDGDPVGTLPVEAWMADETLLVRLPKGSHWSKSINS